MLFLSTVEKFNSRFKPVIVFGLIYCCDPIFFQVSVLYIWKNLYKIFIFHYCCVNEWWPNDDVIFSYAFDDNGKRAWLEKGAINYSKSNHSATDHHHWYKFYFYFLSFHYNFFNFLSPLFWNSCHHECDHGLNKNQSFFLLTIFISIL